MLKGVSSVDGQFTHLEGFLYCLEGFQYCEEGSWRCGELFQFWRAPAPWEGFQRRGKGSSAVEKGSIFHQVTFRWKGSSTLGKGSSAVGKGSTTVGKGSSTVMKVSEP